MFPLMPLHAPFYPGELSATMDTSSSNIAVGDVIILIQRVDGGGNPTTPSGFTSILLDSDDNCRSRSSYKVAEVGDIGGSWANQEAVHIIHNTKSLALSVDMLSTNTDGAYSLAGASRPIGAIYVAERNANGNTGSDATVDSGAQDAEYTEIFYNGVVSYSSHRVDVWKGDFSASSITLANGTTKDSSRWLIVSRA